LYEMITEKHWDSVLVLISFKTVILPGILEVVFLVIILYTLVWNGEVRTSLLP
jgi:hypothetical protein